VTPEHHVPISLTQSLSPDPKLRRQLTSRYQTKFFIRNIPIGAIITIYINIHSPTQHFSLKSYVTWPIFRGETSRQVT